MFWNTVSPLLREILEKIMADHSFNDFRLVGGTALSLHLGHRMSVDIDLFTDASYGSVDFSMLEDNLKSMFPYVDGDFGSNTVLGKSYIVGNDKLNVIKVDIYYTTDPFFKPALLKENIRVADVEEIIAMKVDIIQRGGRKKDFWDLHELLNEYPISRMIEIHKQRFEWTHDPVKILTNFTDFSLADSDFDPLCLLSKEWIFIKEDFIEAVKY